MVFALIGLQEAQAGALGKAVREHFATDHLQITPMSWLLAGNGMTAKEVSDKLGITEGKIGSGIVISFAGYYGRAPANIWEWIAAKSKATPNG